jgi:mRNA interferase MazF
MKRGELVTVALERDPGKRRPALVIQSDLFNEMHPTAPIAFEAVDRQGIRITLLKVLDFRCRSTLGRMLFFQLAH